MKLCRIVPILAIGVLICGQLVLCDSEDNETVDKTTDSESTEEETTTVGQQYLTENSAEVINYDVKDVDNFFTAFKNQLKCGYPMFGIPPLTPLKLSYKFKTSLDFLNMKKIQIIASNFVIYGLDNFNWKQSNTTITRTRSGLTLHFPNITVYADTSLNRANGTSRVSLYDVVAFLGSTFEEKDGLLYLTDIMADASLKSSLVKLAHLFPKSAKLSKIWNKAIGDSIPVVTRLITTRKISVDFINRLVNGSKYYAISTANNAIATYKLDFDGVLDSLKRFGEKTEDSLMCTEEEAAAAKE